MRDNRKGFTLIELLAVIVILAIIALIVTPIILGIISEAREKSNMRSVEAFAKATETAVARLMMDENYDGGEITCTSGASGTAKCTSNTVDENKTPTQTITYSGSTVTCTGNDDEENDGVEVDEETGIITVTECQVGNSAKTYDFNTGSSTGAKVHNGQ